MERTVVNLAGKVRRAKLSGRDYLVAPLTLIVPGVLNGSQGALYYPPEEIKKSATAWNHVPIVVYHPRTGDSYGSARDPSVLNAQGIGVILKAKANGKLSAEGWFDVAAMERIDNRILSALKSNRPIELSTGLFTENEPAENGAEYNGTSYSHIARNYHPDHLAILPDQVGACSLADGCGVLANEEVKKALDRVLGVNANGPSHSNVREQLVLLLQKRFRGVAGAGVVPTYIIDVFDKETVYENQGKLWRIGYTVEKKSGKITLATSSPVEVTRITSYKPVTNKEIKMNEKEKEAIVDGLIKNNCCWNEEDREDLTALTENQLGSLQKQAKAIAEKTKAEADKAKKAEATYNAAKKGWSDPGGNEHTWNEKKGEWETKEKKPVENKDKKPQTEEEWLASAPEGVQEDLSFARNEKAKQKGELIGRLTANIKDDEERQKQSERLGDRSLTDLRADVTLLPEQKRTQHVDNYLGAAAPIGNVGGPKLTPMGLPCEYLETETSKA